MPRWPIGPLVFVLPQARRTAIASRRHRSFGFYSFYIQHHLPAHTLLFYSLSFRAAVLYPRSFLSSCFCLLPGAILDWPTEDCVIIGFGN